MSNPVGQAVARQKLHQALVTQKIKLYMTAKDEPCAEFMEGLSLTLATIGIACETQKIDNVDSRLLRGGFSACQQLMLTGKYDPLQTRAIDAALTAAENLDKKLTAASVRNAWLLVNKGNTQ